MACLLLTMLSAEPIAPDDRSKALSHLHATRKVFLDSIEGLSEAQWNFKPAPDRWSIAECAEHIAVSEDSLFETVTAILKSPPDAADKRALTKGKDELIVKMLQDRSRKVKAPEFLLPKQRWPGRAELTAHFKASRDRNIAWIRDTQDDLRAHLMEHPVLKELDAYQAILFVSAHSERHTLQLNEVKTDPNFPKK